MIVTELLAQFGIEVDSKSVASAESQISRLAGSATKVLGAIGVAFGVGVFKNFVGGLVQVGSELNDTSIKLGIATGALQEWRFAAQQVGVSNEALDGSFKFLAKNSYDAANGGKESASAFRKLGVSVKDSSGKLVQGETLFANVATALAGMSDQSERTALALKVFGRGGQQLLPLLAQGAEGIAKLRQEARDLGGGFDPEFIQAADELGDNLDKLDFATQSLKSSFGNALLPVLTRGLQVIIGWNKSFQAMLKGTKLVQMGLYALAAAATAWGVASVIAGRAAIVAWLRAAAPFLIVAAALTAIVALLEDVHAMLTGGKSLVGKYLDEWLGIGTTDKLVKGWTSGIESMISSVKSLVSIAGEAGGVLGSLFSGDFSGAGQKYADLMVRVAKGAIGFKDDLAEAFDPHLTRGAPALQMDGRGMDANVMGDPSIPRVTGRAFDSPLAPGSAGFGQAAPGSVSSLFSEGNQDAARAFIAPGKARDSAGKSAQAVNQTTTVNTTVNAQTGASPKEIAREARKAVQEGLSKQNRDLKQALVNKTPPLNIDIEPLPL